MHHQYQNRFGFSYHEVCSDDVITVCWLTLGSRMIDVSFWIYESTSPVVVWVVMLRFSHGKRSATWVRVTCRGKIPLKKYHNSMT